MAGSLEPANLFARHSWSIRLPGTAANRGEMRTESRRHDSPNVNGIDSGPPPMAEMEMPRKHHGTGGEIGQVWPAIEADMVRLGTSVY